MKQFSLGLFACAFLGLAAAACDSSSAATTPEGGTETPDGGGIDSGPACPSSGNGTLAVKITGLPDGVKAKVTIEGPAGKQEVEASGTVPIVGGAYSVSGAVATKADPLVRSVFKAAPVTGTSCVKNGETTNVDVVYTLVPSSNKLWSTAGNGDAELVGFSSAKLAATATQTADVAIQLDIPGATAFDREGGLWAVLGSTVAHYLPDVLGTSGEKTADITITVPTGGVPAISAIAFDSAGNLWVSALADNKVHRIAAADLRATGTPANLVTISGLAGPASLAFDATGNLWIAEGGAGDVVEFALPRLAASTTAAPDVVLTAQTPAPVVGPLAAPSGIAFDAAGNMWVDFNDTIARFTVADRAATALVTPAIQIVLDVAALSENLTFDESGGLWFSYSAGKFARLSAEQLAASGTIVPATVISVATLGSASQIAIYPAPAALPIFGKVP